MEILMPATICSKSNNHDFEEAEMPKSHHGVFYKTTTKVRTGDEFYQIVMKNIHNQNSQVFQVEVFHGEAGTPPVEPESVYLLDSEDLAKEKINQAVAEIEGLGFQSYCAAIHGEKDFEPC